MPVEFKPPEIETTLEFLEVSNLSEIYTDIEFAGVASSSGVPFSPVLHTPENDTSRKGHKKRSKSASRKQSCSLLHFIALKGERQIYHLSSTLDSMENHLQHESRRANEAIRRAEYAEIRAVESNHRVLSAEIAQHDAERITAEYRAEVEQCRLRLSTVERELSLAKSDVQRLTTERDRFKAYAERYKADIIERDEELHKYITREEEVDGMHQNELQRWFEEGFRQGWKEGRMDGLEERTQDGRHKQVMDARRGNVRKGLSEDANFSANLPRNSTTERIQKWTEAIYTPTSWYTSRQQWKSSVDSLGTYRPSR